MNFLWNEWRFKTGWEMMRMHRYGNMIGFLGVLVPSVSIKDRSLSVVLIGD